MSLFDHDSEHDCGSAQTPHILTQRRVLTALALALFTALTPLPHEGVLVLSPLLLVTAASAWALGHRDCARFAFATSLLCGFDLLPVLRQNWPLPGLLAGFVTLILESFILRAQSAGSALLYSMGRFADLKNRRAAWFCLSALIAAGAIVIVVCWYHVTGSTPQTVPFKVPPLPAIELFIGFLLFSALNAWTEEFLFRRLAFDAVNACFEFQAPWTANVIQALAFGALHYHGFPSGYSGSVLAFIFGFILGELRIRSKSLILCWWTHVLTDFGMAYFLASQTLHF
jgi:hypothetical protein